MTNQDIRDKIKSHLKLKKITVNQLSQGMMISETHIYKILSKKREISPRILNHLNAVLNTDFKYDNEEQPTDSH